MSLVSEARKRQYGNTYNTALHNYEMDVTVNFHWRELFASKYHLFLLPITKPIICLYQSTFQSFVEKMFLVGYKAYMLQFDNHHRFYFSILNQLYNTLALSFYSDTMMLSDLIVIPKI